MWGRFVWGSIWVPREVLGVESQVQGGKLHDATFFVSLSGFLRARCLLLREDKFLFFCEKAPLGALCHGFASARALLLCASVGKDIR